MAIKYRYQDLLTGTSHVGAGAVSGEARADIGLGAAYGRVLAFEFKGDDADVDVNNTLSLTDAKGRVILAAVALDGGDADAANRTNQEDVIGTTVTAVSTFGIAAGLTEEEDRVYGADGVLTTDNVGAGGGGMLAKSPVTVAIEAGTDGDWHRVGLWVEV